MIGRLFGWNRMALPPAWMIVAFGIIYLFSESLVWFVGWWLDPPGDVAQFVRMRWGCVAIAGAVFAAFRVLMHPLFRPEYRAWLEHSPWTAGKPLPLAPVHLIPQDALVVGVLTLLVRTTGIELLLPAGAFLMAYQVGMAATLAGAGERWAAYGLLFCLAIPARLAQTGLWGIATLALVYPLTYWAHRRCLARFPWRVELTSCVNVVSALTGLYPMGPSQAESGSSPAMPPEPRSGAGDNSLGFPFDCLAPKQEAPSIDVAQGTAISVLAGVWTHALLANMPDVEVQPVLRFFCVLLPLFVTLVRLARYCGTYWPPISLLGRLATGRLIVPRYDRVFVAPLAAVLVVAAGYFLFLRTGMGGTWGITLTLALGLWMNLNLGPRLLDWRLTGGHRIGWITSNPQFFTQP